MTVAADRVATEYERRVDATLELCRELGRALIGAHQGGELEGLAAFVQIESV